MSTQMPAIGGLSGLVLLNLSFSPFDPEQTNRQGNCSPAFLQDTANLLVQFLAQFSIELVSIDRPVKRNRSAFSLKIGKNKCHQWTRIFCRAIARLRNDFPRRDHVPCATRRCSRSG